MGRPYFMQNELEIADFMDDVLPEQKADDEFKEELLDIVADTSEYLVEAS